MWAIFSNQFGILFASGIRIDHFRERREEGGCCDCKKSTTNGKGGGDWMVWSVSPNTLRVNCSSVNNTAANDSFNSERALRVFGN